MGKAIDMETLYKELLYKNAWTSSLKSARPAEAIDLSCMKAQYHEPKENMKIRILVVDDEESVRHTLRRILEPHGYACTMAANAAEARTYLKDQYFELVLSDINMPGESGLDFIGYVLAEHPQTAVVMESVIDDLEVADSALEMGVYGYIVKPFRANGVLINVSNALRRRTLEIEKCRLVISQRELLEKTLKGSVKVLTELLALVNPEAFGRSLRLSRYVKEIVQNMELPDVWQFETAAMLSQIGYVVLPEKALRKIYLGEELIEEEQRLHNMHPRTASDLLANIPRLQEIAEIIAYQEKRFDGSGIPNDSRRGKAIPPGARILKAVLDFDILETTGIPKKKALEKLKQRSGWYDPDVLSALEAVIRADAKYEVREVTVRELTIHMILAEDVRTEKGILLISKGHEVSQPLLERLINITKTSSVKEPIKVFMPLVEDK